MVHPRQLILGAALILGLVLVIATGVQGYRRVAKYRATHPMPPIETVQKATDIPFQNDFDRWMTQVPWFLHQRVSYLDDGFPYPPLMMALFAPLTLLRPPTAMLVFTLLKLPLLITLVWLALAMVRRANITLSPLALCLLLAAWLWPVTGDLQEGQTNLLMLLPLAAALYLAQQQRPGSDMAAGLLLALAITIKVTPLIFLLYFLLRRRLLLTFGTLIGLELWLVGVPALLFGYDQNTIWLHQWSHIMILPYLTRGHVAYPWGQSIPSLLVRFCSHQAAFFTREGQPVFVNILSLTPAALVVVTRTLLAAIGLGGVLYLRPWVAPATFRSGRYLAEVGLVACFMLWASERTWVPHYVALLFPLLAGAALASFPQTAPRARRFLLGALGLTVLGLALTSDLSKVLLATHDGPELVRTFGAAIVPSLLLAVGLLWAQGGKKLTSSGG